MIKFIKDLYWKAYAYFNYTLPDKKFKKEMIKKYPDYDDTKGKMYGEMIQIFTDSPAQGIQGCSDFEIIYYRDTKVYTVDIETAYVGNGDDVSAWELPTLEHHLATFTKFMDDNGYDKNVKPCLFMSQPIVHNTAVNIPELYCNFKMFVYGFKSVCEEITNKKEISDGN